MTEREKWMMDMVERKINEKVEARLQDFEARLMTIVGREPEEISKLMEDVKAVRV